MSDRGPAFLEGCGLLLLLLLLLLHNLGFCSQGQSKRPEETGWSQERPSVIPTLCGVLPDKILHRKMLSERISEGKYEREYFSFPLDELLPTSSY